MRSVIAVLVLVAVAGAVVVGIVNAEGPESRELREHAGRLREKAEHLEREGMEGKATEVRREAERVLHRAEEMESHHRRDREERGDREEAEGRDRDRDRDYEQGERRERDRDREHAERERERDRDRERERDADREEEEREHHHRHREHIERLELIERATDHMLEASELLHEADVHELAEHLEAKAAAMRKQLRQGQHERELHEVIRRLHERIEHMQGQMERMERQIKEVSRRDRD